MAWNSSGRREELPGDWFTYRRPAVLRRDGWWCRHVDDYGERCRERATDVDHIQPGSDHRLGNLRALCSWHHRKKSSSEGGRARAAQRRRTATRFKRAERHPGLIGL